MALLSTLGNYKNTGLLIIRLGIGVMFITHGYPKLLGGPDFWAGVGSNVSHVGITFFYPFWGLMAALAETVGGFLMVIGLAFRPAMLLMAFTMLIASMHHLKTETLAAASHAIEMGVLFLGLAFVGPGKYSVDKR